MRILLTGGSANGKSTYAEALALRFPVPRIYVATMQVFGQEEQDKVIRHQQMRAGKGFTTLERTRDLQGLQLPPGSTLLLECLCNLTANELFDPAGQYTDAREKIISDVLWLAEQCDTLIVVTNDVGSDGQAYEAKTQAYIQALGDINQALATRFDCVAELVCGFPLVLKGKLV